MKMKLEFIEDDFYSKTIIQEYVGSIASGKVIKVKDAVVYANAKLENYIKEHGKVVYAPNISYAEWRFEGFLENQKRARAILINIEPIQKCEHPKEKVDYNIKMLSESRYGGEYLCECGAKVEPVEFRAVE